MSLLECSPHPEPVEGYRSKSRFVHPERRAMKIYEGARSLDGAIVTVDGKKLPPRLDLRTFSKAGFEWTYEGAGPAQLALALLADHLGDDQAALAHDERFMPEIPPNLDNAAPLSSADTDAPLKSPRRPA